MLSAQWQISLLSDAPFCDRLFHGSTMIRVFGLQDVRNPIKDIPIHHLQVGSLGDRWFLMHILEIDYVIVVPCFKFQVCRMSGTPSMTPLSTISRLDLWVTGDS